MKGKKLLSLISILASAAVVGTTFAIYAVSDEADPFGVKITPGSISTDDTPFVTLRYGDTPQKANISELENGKPRLAAIVDLIADTSDGTGYSGKFNLALADETEGKPELEAKLIDNLSVKVYGTEIEGVLGGEVTTDLSALSPLGTLAKSSEVHSASIQIDVSDNTAKRVYVVVSLETSDSATLSVIANDIVGLTMDWSKGSNLDIEATSVYLKKHLGEGQEAYVYAWKSSDISVANAAYPGIPMTSEGGDLYSYLLSTAFDRVIFSVKDSEGEKYKSADLEVELENRQSKTTYYAGIEGSEHWGSKPDSSLTAEYYIKGTVNDWAASAEWALTKDDENHYHISNVNLAAGAKIKVWGKENDNWFTSENPWDLCGFTKDDEGNVVVTNEGTYTVDFYIAADNDNHIVLS